MSTINQGPNIITNNLIVDLQANSSSYGIKTPKQISGCVLWLDASDSSSVVLTSGKVSQWSDKSGNLNHVTQSNASYRPNYVSNSINNLNTIYFTQSSGTNLRKTNFPADTTKTVFLVFNAKYGPSNARILNFSYGTATADFGVYTQNSYKNYFLYSNSGGGASSFTGSGYVDNNNIITITQNGYAANSTTLYENGKVLGTFSPNTTSTWDDAGLTIGGNGNTTSGENFTGNVGELIIYNSVLSTKEREQIENYLSKKWRIKILKATNRVKDLTSNTFVTVANNNLPIIDDVFRLDPNDANGSPKTTNSYMTRNAPFASGITQEAWVKMNNHMGCGGGASTTFSNDQKTIISLRPAYLLIDSIRRPYTWIYNSNFTEFASTTSNFKVSNNTWTHLATTYDGNKMRLYVNGQISSTSATDIVTGLGASSFTFGIGSESNGTQGRMLDGYLDNIKIYNQTLTSDQIFQNYEASKTKYLNLQNLVTDNLIFNIDADVYTSYTDSAYTNNNIVDIQNFFELFNLTGNPSYGQTTGTISAGTHDLVVGGYVDVCPLNTQAISVFSKQVQQISSSGFSSTKFVISDSNAQYNPPQTSAVIRKAGKLLGGSFYESTNPRHWFFDGTDDYADFGNVSLLNLSSSDFSMSCWFQMQTFENNNTIFDIFSYGAATCSIQVNNIGNPRFVLRKNGNIGTDVIVSGLSNLQLSGWSNITITKTTSPTLGKIYIDGILSNSNNYGSLTFNTNTSGVVLAKNADSNVFANCKVANAQVYSKALSDDEVLQNYNYHKYKFGK